MNKLFYLISAITLIFGCEQKKDHTSIEIKGMGETPTVNLYAVNRGSMKQIASSENLNGECGFYFKPQNEGFYVIGNGKSFDHPFYLKGGEAITVDLTDTKRIKADGVWEEESELFNEWAERVEEIKYMGPYFMGARATFKEFNPAFEKLNQDAEDFRKQAVTDNDRFNELFLKTINYELDYYSLCLLYTPRQVHPKPEERLDYYKTIKDPKKFESDIVLEMPYGSRYLSMYLMHHAMRVDLDKRIPLIMENFPNDKVKAELLLAEVLRVRDHSTFVDKRAGLKQYFNDEHNEILDDKEAALYAKIKTGKAADFTYPDINGKKRSLSDYKGKVVVVDVWATWCGPCRQQIPHLKKLEKELHGKDVVFMGVSLDEKKNYDKWKEMVKKEELGGVQLFANGWSKIAKDYQIKGIPRFMVFDKEGNIVSTEAPRPSSSDLKRMIERELKK